MHPVIFKLGPITIYSYGFFFSLCFATGVVVAARRAKRAGYDPGDIIDLAVVMFVAGLIGGRFFHLLEKPMFYLKNPLQAFNVYQGGLVFYGSVIFSIACTSVFCRLRGLNVFTFLDFIAPGIALGHVWGRIGCFMGGCCYGRPTDSWLGVVFKTTVDEIPRLPTQLFEAAGNLVIGLSLLAIERRWKRFEGFTFANYVLIYGVFRFMIEFIRDDDRGGYLLGLLSMSQVISLAGVTLAVSFLVYKYRRLRAQQS